MKTSQLIIRGEGRVSTTIRWALSLGIIGAAWFFGEIGPFTALLLFLMIVRFELDAWLMYRLSSDIYDLDESQINKGETND